MKEEEFLELLSRIESNISAYRVYQTELNKKAIKSRIIELCRKVERQ
jgi:hypothetical protein